MRQITEATARTVKTALQSLLGEEALSVDTEIQDGGYFLLVTIEVDSMCANKDSILTLEKAASVLPRYIGPRTDEYAWMVNITCRGSLIDSESGGLYSSP